MPRPLKYINTSNARNGIPEKYQTRTNECPPSQGIPYISIDEGQSAPKYIRCTVTNAP